MVFFFLLISLKGIHTHMQIYITDTTKIPVKDVIVSDYGAAVRYLEDMTRRAFGQSRKGYMLMLESMGHGEDDSNAINFVRAMSERFSIGVLREGKKMRCDITSVFMFNKPEYGS